jgi:hypothetical protein
MEGERGAFGGTGTQATVYFLNRMKVPRYKAIEVYGLEINASFRTGESILSLKQNGSCG